jgi:hypothetical protein
MSLALPWNIFEWRRKNRLIRSEEGKTSVEYDSASSLFGQFGNAKVTEVAMMLDRKMEQLVAQAIQ